MANQRPINRRPWRRAPWRKSRRPASWHDANSTGSLGGGVFGGAWATLEAPSVVPGSAVSTLRELIVGDIDGLYLDREEVRIDRLVGDIEFYTSSSLDAAPVALPPVVRFGLVVEEDPRDSGTSYPVDAYNLWDPAVLKDAEFMYLEQPVRELSNPPLPGDSVTYREFYWHSHLDVRVKRKLGKADRLWLVMSYANGLEGSSPSNNWGSPVFESHMLRCVLVA